MDPLSLTASAFAVIGAADVVLRAGTEFIRFLSDIKDAPAEIEKLRLDLQETTLIVEASKDYLETLNNGMSDSWTSLEKPGLDKAVSLFGSAIRSLKRELESLVTIARKHHGASKPYGRIQWLLDARRVARAQQSLENSKATLNTALALVVRRDAAVTAQALERTIDRSLQALTSTVNQRSISINQGQKKLSMQLNRAHRVHLNRMGLLGSKIDDLQLKISEQAAIKEIGGRKIFFLGENRESVMIQLLHMREQVRAAVLCGLSQPIDGAMAGQLSWLQSEYDNLVSSATQELAALSPGSTATLFDTWYDSGFAVHNSKTITRTGRCRRKRLHEAIMGPSAGADDPDQETPRKRPRRACKSLAYGDASGRLLFNILGVKSGLKGTENSQEVSLFFEPAAASFYKASISARFIKEVRRGCEPRFYTQLNAFTVVQDNKRYIRLMFDGSVQEVDAAFRKGEISPYHVLNDNTSGDARTLACIGLAARYRRTDLLRYFDSQGIGITNLDDGLSALSGFWNGILDFPLESRHPDFAAMVDYIAEIFPDFDICGDPQNSGPPGCSRAYDKNPDSALQMMRKFIKLLKAENFNFEEGGHSQSTSLLRLADARGRHSTEICRLLCKNGVNIHATDTSGRNALHLAMYSQCRQREAEPFLEERFALWIEGGVDLHQIDTKGHTPSVLADEFDCWYEWCRALENNGLTIDDVLRDEAGLWIFSDRDNKHGDDEPGAEHPNLSFPKYRERPPPRRYDF